MRQASVEVAGCRLFYELAGEGPPILFIQGVGLHGAGWMPQVTELKNRFTCVTFDNRGMGRSQPSGAVITVEQMAEDALAVMADAGIDSAHVVGHSLGGPVAIEMALMSRQRVKSLSLLCTVGRGRDATRLGRRMLWLGLRSRIGTRAARRHAFLEIVLSPPARAERSAESWAEVLEPLFGHDIADQPPIAMKQLAALRRFDASSRLRSLRQLPTLVVSANLDPIAPPRFGKKLAEDAGGRFVTVASASHGLPIEYPEQVNALLAEHVMAAESLAIGRIGVVAQQ